MSNANPRRLDLHAKSTFWKVVGDCLMEFHQCSQACADGKVAELRNSLKHPPRGVALDILYHAEPLDVACDLAARRLELSNYREVYEGILKRHNW